MKMIKNYLELLVLEELLLYVIYLSKKKLRIEKPPINEIISFDFTPILINESYN